MLLAPSVQCIRKQAADRKPTALYYGSANLLYEAKFWGNGFESRMEAFRETVEFHRLPTVVVGLGTQAVFDANNRTPDLTPGRRVQFQPRNFELNLRQIAFLKSIQRFTTPCGGICVRGKFTLAVIQRYCPTCTNVRACGCPSLFINTRVDLGDVLARKYHALKSRSQEPDFKVAVNLPPYFAPGLVRSLLLLVRDHPGSFVVAQSVRELRIGIPRAMALLGIVLPQDALRLYYDVLEWRDALKMVDLVIGSRIHGCMLGIAAETPAITIAPDWRVKELSDQMLLPTMNVYDPMLTERSPIAAAIMQADIFDAAIFNQNRCRLAAIYEHFFRRAHIPFNPNVRRIAMNCSWKWSRHETLNVGSTYNVSK